ncbi:MULTISPECIES: VanZ family protein [Haloferax]|uniref:VanZ like family protein n=1 Tax=Haloferax massiliensis TaxID=1476858 RepID=A0A0D6JSZ1_9EURY|nr:MULTISPECIES: VanZ family protein [Haloferax]MDS0242004.1 VanZ family protein [Haloferax sp. S2CR25]MDS0445125.1 VanZ family protein [Haloferax sp. S2CR25-2]CQR51026.1 VanZ like family protein [Haloferax massiliensis]
MNPIARLRENPRRAAVALGYAFVVLVASVVPTPPGSLTPMGPLGLVGLDKWVHAAGYAGLGFGFAAATRARGREEVAAAVVAAGAFGAGIEVVQAVLPYRSFGVADAGANLVGAVLGGVVWVALVRVAESRR